MTHGMAEIEILEAEVERAEAKAHEFESEAIHNDEIMLSLAAEVAALKARIAEMEATEKELEHQNEFVAGRHFSCDCGLPWHALYVGPFFGELMDEAELFNSVVMFTVVVEPDSLWERLKGAVRVLFGRYDYHEMSISREQWPAFVEHINHIDGACKRTRERYENMRI